MIASGRRIVGRDEELPWGLLMNQHPSTPCRSAESARRTQVLDEPRGDAPGGARLKHCCAANEKAASFMDQPAGRLAPTSIQHPLAQPGTRHRPLQAPRADRRRRLRRRLCGRAGKACPPQGRAENHQAGHGHQGCHRPLRGRAAGPGPDGPSQRRPRARRRRDRQRPALLRHGAGPRRADHRVLRQEQAPDPRPAAALRRCLPGRAACPPERASSTAT